MDFPVFFQLGPHTIHPHWVFETLAYSLAFYCYRWQRRHHGDVIDGRTRWWVIGAAAVGGLIGSRLLAFGENPAAPADHWLDPVSMLEGKTIVGGLIGGLIAVETVKWLRGVTVATGDLLVVPLLLGIAVGRVGCFLSGLPDRTYGVQSTLPWAIDFGDGITRHPTQLYEIAFLAVLLIVIAQVRERLMTNGDQFKVFMIAYLGFRLAVDFIKPSPTIVGLSVIQWACLAVIAYYAPHVPRLVSEVRHG